MKIQSGNSEISANYIEMTNLNKNGNVKNKNGEIQDTFVAPAIAQKPSSVAKGEKKSLVSKWDIPGIFTFSWFATAIGAIRDDKRSSGYGSGIGSAIGVLMLLASPIVAPISLAADAINTTIFPAKVGYRAVANKD